MKSVKYANNLQKKIIEDAWLNLDGFSDDVIKNPIKDIPECAIEEPYIFLTYCMSRPEYFAAFCKYVMNIDLLQFQSVIQTTLFSSKFPMLIATRGGSKSWSLGLYCLLRMVFIPNRKIIVCGAGFRQSKIIFEYMDSMWHNSPLLRDMLQDRKVGGFKDTDMWRFLLNGGSTSCLPVGSGDKIRGQRANDLICDEFSAINPHIFETVMAGFAAVSSDPVSNVKRAASLEAAKKMGIDLEYDPSGDVIKSNQIIISGTAYYEFNHFASYWKRWKAIINSLDDPKGLEEYYPEGIPRDLKKEDYSIIRLPVELIPADFMDMGQVARTRGSINEGVFQNEYGAVFSADSDGFFRRTLIESCIAHLGKIYKNKEDCYFEPRIYGDPALKYVMGIDPASENDNFSIVLLELREGHRRLVYSWTTTRKNHQARLKSKLVEEHDFYSYVNRKVRDLMERFDIEHIIIDSQGGGYAVIEAFKNEGNMKEYERAILEVRDPSKPKDSDRREGHHIVELASFADAKWFSAANHGMKKDMEEQELIFPSFDALALGLAIEQDKLEDRVVDTIQDCVEEVELLKDELCTIVMKQTTAGREQFVTPEEVTNGSKRRQKKDRYSSLVIANMAARIIQNDDTVKIRPHIGDFAGNSKKGSGPMYYGNDVANNQLTDAYRDYD